MLGTNGIMVKTIILSGPLLAAAGIKGWFFILSMVFTIAAGQSPNLKLDGKMPKGDT